MVCWNWLAWARVNQLSESLPSSVQRSYIGSWASLMVGVFTLWKLANAANLPLFLFMSQRGCYKTFASVPWLGHNLEWGHKSKRRVLRFSTTPLDNEEKAIFTQKGHLTSKTPAPALDLLSLYGKASLWGVENSVHIPSGVLLPCSSQQAAPMTTGFN